MRQRAFITGIAGFAGGYLARHLLDCGDEVFGSAVAARWEPTSEPGLADQVGLVAWDLESEGGLDGEARRQIRDFFPTVIYHLAALSVPADCGSDEPTPRALAVNVAGTRRVVELAAAMPSRPRVLLVSTSHVYGRRTKATARVDEQCPTNPRGGYGKSKAMAEQIVLEAVREGRVDAVIARVCQHSGPRQPPRLMLPEWARQFADGTTPVRIYTADAYLDLSDVRDVVRAYRLLAERGESGEVYCVGSGQSRRTGDIFQQLRAMADPHRPFVETHPGEKFEPVADITRLTRRTGWRPTIPLQQTLRDTLAYWRRQVAAERR